MRESLRRFRRKPAFTGCILFLVVLVLNIVIQGWSACLSGGVTIGNMLSFFQPTALKSIFMTNLPFILVTVGQALLLLDQMGDGGFPGAVPAIEKVHKRRLEDNAIKRWGLDSGRGDTGSDLALHLIPLQDYEAMGCPK